MIVRSARKTRGHSRNASSHKRRIEPVSTPEPPADLIDGLFATVEKDGRVRFDLARRRKSIAHITLSANQAGEIAANALGGAYDAFDRAMMGVAAGRAQGSLSLRAHHGPRPRSVSDRGPRLPRRPRGCRRARVRVSKEETQGVCQVVGGKRRVRSVGPAPWGQTLALAAIGLDLPLSPQASRHRIRCGWDICPERPSLR